MRTEHTTFPIIYLAYAFERQNCILLRLLIHLFPNWCHKSCTSFALPSAMCHVPEDSKVTRLFRDSPPFSSSEDSQILHKAFKIQHYRPFQIWTGLQGTQLGGGPLPATDTDYWGLGHTKVSKTQSLLLGAYTLVEERDTWAKTSVSKNIQTFAPTWVN